MGGGGLVDGCVDGCVGVNVCDCQQSIQIFLSDIYSLLHLECHLSQKSH